MIKLSCNLQNDSIKLHAAWRQDLHPKFLPALPTKIIRDILDFLQGRYDVYEMAPPVENRYSFVEKPYKRIKFARNLLFPFTTKEKYFYKIDRDYLKFHNLPKDDWASVYAENKQDLQMDFDLFAEMGSMLFDAEFHAIAVLNSHDFFEKIQGKSFNQFCKYLSDLFEVEIINREDEFWEIRGNEPIIKEIAHVIEPYLNAYA